MRDWWPRILILTLLAVVLGVPFALRPREPAAARAVVGGSRLIIITPHNEQIRHEFARGFNRWRASQGLPAVAFDWRSGGGTSDLRRQVLDQLHAAAAAGREEQGIGYDLFFGGGDFEHNLLARGIAVERDGAQVIIPATVALPIPESRLQEVFPEPTIGGELLYHPEMHWIGATLSAFGVVYNRDVLGMLGVPEPQTWSDLTEPRYFTWVALADPGKSGSIAQTYNIILRRVGWTEGWMMLRRTFANARYFTASASKVPVDVSAGEAAAGMCIDFYGRFQAGAIAGERIGYVDPRFMTAITADPISVIRGAPSRELAEQFVLWLLSPEAQGLWQRRLGTPDGPERFELRRLPIRRDMYHAREKVLWTDDVDPFAIARALPEGTPNYYSAVAPIAHAMAIDVHDDLRAAWRAILKHPNHPRREEMLQLFDAMPAPLVIRWPEDELEQQWSAILEQQDHPRRAEVVAILNGFTGSLRERWKDRDQELRDRLEWSLFFRDNYRRIVALSKQK